MPRHGIPILLRRGAGALAVLGLAGACSTPTRPMPVGRTTAALVGPEIDVAVAPVIPREVVALGVAMTPRAIPLFAWREPIQDRDAIYVRRFDAAFGTPQTDRRLIAEVTGSGDAQAVAVADRGDVALIAWSEETATSIRVLAARFDDTKVLDDPPIVIETGGAGFAEISVATDDTDFLVVTHLPGGATAPWAAHLARASDGSVANHVALPSAWTQQVGVVPISPDTGGPAPAGYMLGGLGPGGATLRRIDGATGALVGQSEMPAGSVLTPRRGPWFAVDGNAVVVGVRTATGASLRRLDLSTAMPVGNDFPLQNFEPRDDLAAIACASNHSCFALLDAPSDTLDHVTYWDAGPPSLDSTRFSVPGFLAVNDHEFVVLPGRGWEGGDYDQDGTQRPPVGSVGAAETGPRVLANGATALVAWNDWRSGVAPFVGRVRPSDGKLFDGPGRRVLAGNSSGSMAGFARGTSTALLVTGAGSSRIDLLTGTPLDPAGLPDVPSTGAVGFGGTSYLLAGPDVDPSGHSTTLYAQRLDEATGTLVGTRQALSNPPVLIERIDVALGGSNYLVVWTQAAGLSDTAPVSLFARRVRASDGAPIDAAPIPISLAANVDLQCRVVWTGREWIVVWPEGPYGQTTLFAARIDATGAVVATELPLAGTSNSAIPFAIASDGATLFVGWRDATRKLGSRYRLTDLSALEAANPATLLTFGDTTGGSQYTTVSDVAANGRGTYLVAYERFHPEAPLFQTLAELRVVSTADDGATCAADVDCASGRCVAGACRADCAVEACPEVDAGADASLSDAAASLSDAAAPPSDAGRADPDASPGDAGAAPSDAAPSDAASDADAAPPRDPQADAAPDASASGTDPPAAEGGCSCRVTPSTRGSYGATGVAFGMFLVLRRRRRASR